MHPKVAKERDITNGAHFELLLDIISAVALGNVEALEQLVPGFVETAEFCQKREP